METRGLLAEWDEAQGHLTVYGAAKVAFANRRMLAQLMGLPEGAIRMVENDVGGAFGVRGEFYPEDFLIPFAARRLGRPVKWIEDRREHLIATNHARDVECELEIACDRDGTILALRGHAQHRRRRLSAHQRRDRRAQHRAGAVGAVSHPARSHRRVACHVTNKTPVGTYRGPGRFEADFFRERLLDMVAGDLGIDRRRIPPPQPDRGSRDALRARHGRAAQYRDRDRQRRLPHHARSLPAGNRLEPARPRLQGKLIDGRYHGLAIGCYIEGGASGPNENARLVLETDGTVSVYVGSSVGRPGNRDGASRRSRPTRWKCR